MYHPTTRLLTVLELLRSHGRLSGPELARRLEVDVRTVRRYISMLQDLGIPIDGETGRHGGYALRPSYKLPPLMFNEDEVIALTVGLLLARQVGLGTGSPAVARALTKIERVLPAEMRERARAVQATVGLTIEIEAVPIEGPILSTLSLAVQESRAVEFRYVPSSGEERSRKMNPYGVASHGGKWYMAGYCHTRSDVRVFRLDRMAEVKLLEERFTPPAGFDALAHVLRRFAEIPDRWDVEVLLNTTMERARRRVPRQLALLEEHPDGVLLRSSIHDLDTMARFLVGLGCPFAIHGPPELRGALGRLAEEVRTLAGMPASRSRGATSPAERA